MENHLTLLITLAVLSMGVYLHGQNVYSTLHRTNFDLVMDQMTEVKSSDCRTKTREQLTLPENTVSQIPIYTQLKSRIFYPNRSALVQMHNMALNRAMFYSFILQKLNKTQDFDKQPSWLYLFMGVTADINGNKDIFNGSMIAFDNNVYYPNWMPETVKFNKTLPLFAPKAWREDDTYEPTNFLREPTRRTNIVKDIGAGANQNFTVPDHRSSPWYDFWLPDLTSDRDSVQKFTYSVGIKYSNETGKFIYDDFLTTNFFGPNSPGQSDHEEYLLPVRFTRPYFDCGESNLFVLTAAAPIVDYMPRYSDFIHMRRPRFVGVVTMDMKFQEVDYNACGISLGNPGPCFLCGTHRCGKGTACKHRAGRGFRRGGYICHCSAGKYYPWHETGPFIGTDLEISTDFERNNSFMCHPAQYLRVPPVVIAQGVNVAENQIGTSSDTGGIDTGTANLVSDEFQAENRQFVNDEGLKREKRELDSIVKKYSYKSNALSAAKKTKRRKKRAISVDKVAIEKMVRIFAKKQAVTAANCLTMSPGQRELPGEVAYGANTQFDNQARFALKISHLLSNFLQNVNPNENFGLFNGGGRIHEDVLFGEVLANVMSDFKIVSSGILYEPFVFENQDGSIRELFGPTAWKAENGNYYALDAAGLPERYTDNEFYLVMKHRWKTNTHGLEKYRMKALVRNDPNGTSTIRHEHYPVTYKAPAVSDGHWTRPYFKCDGRVNQWVITYIVPFIGKHGITQKLIFKGAVYVDIPLDYLDINQCAQPFYVANAFKNTAMCDYRTQTCTPITGYKFTRSNYKCVCKRGFEYPWRDGRLWVHGSLLELEYLKKQKGLFNIFDAQRCNVSGSSHLNQSTLFVLILALFVLYFNSSKSYISSCKTIVNNSYGTV